MTTDYLRFFTPEIWKKFWSRTRLGPDGPLGRCFDWNIGGETDYGYFFANLGGGKSIYRSSHRFAWVFSNGEIPDGLFVLHKCDRPVCCNPDHLFLGTAQDNTNDMIRKGRQKITPKTFRKRRTITKL